MACSRDAIWNAPARLINRRWGFEAEWVPLRLALEQFGAHASELQDGLSLQWKRGGMNPYTLMPDQIRSLAGKLPVAK